MSDGDFISVERRALEAIGANSARTDLGDHLANIGVDCREPTEVGFCTYLAHRSNLAPITDFIGPPDENVPAGGVHMDVEGLIAGLFVVLWYVDGYPARIEAATYAGELIAEPVENLRVVSAMPIWPSPP